MGEQLGKLEHVTLFCKFVLIVLLSLAQVDSNNPHDDYNSLPNTREFDIVRKRRNSSVSTNSSASRVSTSTSDTHFPFSHSPAFMPSPYPMHHPSAFSNFGVPWQAASPFTAAQSSSQAEGVTGGMAGFGLVTQAEEMALRQGSKGGKMSLDDFCTTFDLPSTVKDALKAEEIDGPQTLASLSMASYTQPISKQGLNLKVGAAIRLKNAMLQWAKGEQE
jgi:hypothetical protein